MNVEKIRIVKNGKRYKRVVIPDGWEKCTESVAEMVTWGIRYAWVELAKMFTGPEEVRASRPIYIRRKAQP